MKHFRLNALSALAAAVVLLGTGAQAATLAPGDSIFMPGATAATNPELTGAVVHDEVLSSPNIGVPTLPFLFARFEVQNRVVQSGVDGTMVFMPRVLFGANVTLGNLLVDTVAMYGFGDFAIDAFYRTDDAGDRGPARASRSPDGDTLVFDFDFPIVVNNLVAGPQQESYFFALKSNATAFDNTGRISIFARAEGDNFNTYRFDIDGLAVPTSALPPVPLPGAAWLLICALGGLAALRRTRPGARSRNPPAVA